MTLEEALDTVIHQLRGPDGSMNLNFAPPIQAAAMLLVANEIHQLNDTLESLISAGGCLDIRIRD